MTSEGCVLVAQFGFLLDFVFGKVSDSGFGVAGLEVAHLPRFGC
jgi:hypothetical protein